jgi:D-alanine-D-alanine ligase-like ATP-grasp enzyme
VFGFPYIVKPNKGAGSKGVTKVETRKEIKGVVSLALKQDHQGLIEPHTSDGVEVTRRSFLF